MPSRLSVVIPCYNGATFIIAALRSLEAQSRRPDEIVVVDDASTDGSADLVQAEFPDVVLIRRPTNGGFGQACNQGIQHALDSGAECVCLLNQDATLQPDALERLSIVMQQQPQYGLLSALQLNYEGTGIDRHFRHFVPSGYWDDLVLGKPKEVYSAPFMAAAAVLLRREALLDVGGFDPLFPMYGEDNDLCFRLRSAGWHIGLVPAARVQHWHGLLQESPNFQRMIILEYAQCVLHLKVSSRSLPVAFASLLRYRGRPSAWCDLLVKPAAILKCAAKYRQIARSRMQCPHAFRLQGTDSSSDSAIGTSSADEALPLTLTAR